ncbi:MAG: hypothetical protein RR263_05270 [Oscillospiraceae bacterium]
MKRGETMRKSTGVNINTGTTPILVIFVLLCLTTFATLSMVSANADFKLTSRASEASAAYYTADSVAQEKLAEIDTILMSISTNQAKEEYFAVCTSILKTMPDIFVPNGKDVTVTYKVPIDENRALEVSLEILYPPEANGKRYLLNAWRPIAIGEWIEDDSIPVWDGT